MPMQVKAESLMQTQLAKVMQLLVMEVMLKLLD